MKNKNTQLFMQALKSGEHEPEYSALEWRRLKYKSAKIAGFDLFTESSPGEVRLVAGASRLAFVLILDKWFEGWLVMPFSEYHYPATDSELKIPMVAGRNILQGWNCRSILTVHLNSWIEGRVSKKTLKDAKDIWAYSSGWKKFPVRLASRVGGPIVNSRDPRIKYMREADQRFADIDLADLDEP